MRKLFLFFLAAVLALSLCSCFVFGVATGAASAIQRAVAKLTLIGYTDYWKNGIPSNIPEFKFGTYNGKYSYKTSDDSYISYSLWYAGVMKQNVEDYGKALKDAGYDVRTKEDDKSYSIIGNQLNFSSSDPKRNISGLGQYVIVTFVPESYCGVTIILMN